jgi:hypothetical protein
MFLQITEIQSARMPASLMTLAWNCQADTALVSSAHAPMADIHSEQRDRLMRKADG